MTAPSTAATSGMNRRHALTLAGMAFGLASSGALLSADAPSKTTGSRFTFCLNTGTIRGQKLGIVKEIEVAAKAGYQAIEPWVESIDQYAKGGGSLKDLKQRVIDAGITVESAIGFPEWIVEDDAKRAKGMERAKFEMDLVAQIGGKRIAAPPSGATQPAGLDLQKAAERYRALLELGDQMGVTPQLEVWGFSKNLTTLAQCAYVAMETGHPKACVLADVFHLYNGRSNFNGLRLLSGKAIQVFHMNDYPADPPLGKINDSFRVLPGDGVAPLTQILQDISANSNSTVLSLELFNKKYYEMDALEAARLGLEKMKAAAQKAMV